MSLPENRLHVFTLKITTLLMESGDVVLLVQWLDQLKRTADSQNFGSGELSLISD